jgi:hypothetical protein
MMDWPRHHDRYTSWAAFNRKRNVVSAAIDDARRCDRSRHRPKFGAITPRHDTLNSRLAALDEAIRLSGKFYP